MVDMLERKERCGWRKKREEREGRDCKLTKDDVGERRKFEREVEKKTAQGSASS